VNWNIESDLWMHLFSSKMLHINPRDHELVATAPLFAPAALSETMDQVVFEEFGFASHARVSAAEMCVLSYAEYCRQQSEGGDATASVEPSPKRKRPASSALVASPIPPTAESDEDWRAFHRSSCQLVIDSGFSFTHVVPVIDGKVFLPGVKRINVGGKLLTNYLKEIVSYRQWNVMDESVVINELKEALCYCSLDLDQEMEQYHRDRSTRKHWVLPDFVRSFHGRLRADRQTADDEEQALEMGVEMVTVPEVLFHPSDIGIDQAGLAETIMQCVNGCPPDVQSTLLDNILLVGGNTKFRNFRERLERELRPFVPDEFEFRLLTPDK
jgi:actin-related protein 6